MAKFWMAITILALPYYIVRSLILRWLKNDDLIHREMKMYPRHYFGIRGKKIVIHRKEEEKENTFIYISNHQSHNDIFVALGSVPRPFRFVAKKELFQSLMTSSFMKMSKSYPLDRDDPRQSMTILKQALKDLEAGHSIFVFPEGTRSRQKEMLEFKEGLFSILRRANVPIIPLYIKESFMEKNKEIHVYFGEAIPAEVYHELSGSKLTQFVREKMEELKDEAYQ